MTRFRTGLGAPAVGLITGCAVALLVASPWVPRAQAYPVYDDGMGAGCVQCHSEFSGPGTLHSNHRNTFGITNSGCNLCHPSGQGSTPVYTFWSGEGFGCAGCHGRDYGETSVTVPHSGQPKATAYGLRQFHVNHGIATCGIAGGCHVPGNLGHSNPFPPIFAESVAPPYYGSPLDNLTDPCSSAEEDMAFDNPDMVGLDNDGDGAADYPADSDCAPPTTTTTTLPPNSGDVGITGKKLVIVDKITAAGKAKIAYVAKDTTANKGDTNDPAQIGAEFAYQCTTLGSSGSAAMPQGASVDKSPGWLVNKATVAKYVNKGAPSGGAVKVAVIKPAKLLKAVMKDLGDAGSKIDIYQGGATTSSVDVTTQYTVVDGATVRRHCGEFTGCARKIIAGGTGAKVVCKNATAGGSVTCPGSPSGAFLR